MDDLTPEEMAHLDELAQQAQSEQAREEISEALVEINCWDAESQRELLARLQGLLETGRVQTGDRHVLELLADVYRRTGDLLDTLLHRQPPEVS
jgi:hypothetical protein